MFYIHIELWMQWNYIASRAFADGEYSHERDKKAQQELLFTREDRLVPLPLGLLLSRPGDIQASLEKDMPDHYGRYAYDHGYFWNKALDKLPEKFAYKQTRQWFHTIILWIAQWRY